MLESQFGTASTSQLLPSIHTFLTEPPVTPTVPHVTSNGGNANLSTFTSDKKSVPLTPGLSDKPAGGQLKSRSWLTPCPASLPTNVDQIIQQTSTISDSITSLNSSTIVEPDIWLDTMTASAKDLLSSLHQLQHYYNSRDDTATIYSRREYDLIWSRRVSKGRLGRSKSRKRIISTPRPRCHSCNTTETPEWRRGPDGARTLCNACGLHYAKLSKRNIQPINPKYNMNPPRTENSKQATSSTSADLNTNK